MTRRFEIHVRCAGCRHDVFVEVVVRGIDPSTDEIVRQGQPQLARFTCPKCKGRSGRVSGVFPMKKTAQIVTMALSEAHAIATKAFVFLAASEVRLARFLTDTGIEPETVREAAGTPAFLGGVLDYILADTDLLMDTVEALGVEAAVIAGAAKSMSRPQPKAPQVAPEPEVRPSKSGGGKKALLGSLPPRPMFRARQSEEAA